MKAEVRIDDMKTRRKNPLLLGLLVLGLGLSSCAGQAETTAAVKNEGGMGKEEDEIKASPADVKRILSLMYLTDQPVRAEKNYFVVHLPYFVSANELSKHIKPSDVVSAAWHYEAWSGSGSAFDDSSEDIYSQFSEDFRNGIREMENKNHQFLKSNAELISSEKWSEIPSYELNEFYDNLDSIEDWKKFDMSTPIFYKFILKASEKDIAGLKSAHPGIKFSPTVHYKERMEEVQKIIDADEARYFYDRKVTEEELRATALRELEKRGMKK